MDALFRTFRVDAAEVARIAEQPNAPHQHDFEELLIGVAGSIEHFIDFESRVTEAPFVAFVTRGKLHRLKPGITDGACDMRVLRFRSEFIPETIFQLYALFHGQADIGMSPGPCFDRLVALAEMIEGEMQQPEPDLAVVRQLLSTLFTLIGSEQRKLNGLSTPLPVAHNETFRNFLRILEDNYRQQADVDFYAAQLFMTPRNLNRICQAILQQSVSRIIETRKLIEAKQLLLNTDQPVSSIGMDLGYDDKAYFARVFKKNTGQTPTEFREEMRKVVG